MPTEPSVPHRVLRQAMADGVITAAQLERLLAAGDTAADTGADTAAAGGPERPRLDVPQVAAWAGALLVLFAFGWFLVDRWRALGSAGVLAVTLGYAALFLVLHVRLVREGHRVAGGLALMLVVGMAPLAGWAAQEWLLPLDPAVRAVCHQGWDPIAACTLRPITIELVTVLAGLLARRRMHFAPLALPDAVALAFAGHHVSALVLHSRFDHATEGLVLLATASVLLAIAYAVDRREAPSRVGGALEDDHAAWLYPPALATGAFALSQLWGAYPELRHLLPLVSLALAAGALRLGRGFLLAAAGAALLWYLGWLAFDVFRDDLAFPLLLAALGLAVMALGVVVRRLVPRLARPRAAAGRDSPVAWVVILAPLVLALLLLPEARRLGGEERGRRAAWEARTAAIQRREARARSRAAADSAARASRPAETRPDSGA